jgi:hypothetical protein
MGRLASIRVPFVHKPGGDETPVRGPLSRLDVPTSRQDPLAPYDPTDPAMRWIDEPTSRTDPVTRTVVAVPLVQGRRFRHHQPYTTGQRGPHR